MDKKNLDELIKELEDLQIQQEAVIKKIRQRASTEEAPQSADQSTRQAASTSETKSSFHAGQRVLIKNRLGHLPFGRKASIKDRVGTVTKITQKRVHITTVNNTETSRAPHNLTRLDEKEYDDIIKRA